MQSQMSLLFKENIKLKKELEELKSLVSSQDKTLELCFRFTKSLEELSQAV